MKPFVVVAAALFALPAGARLGNAAYIVATSCNGCHSGATRPLIEVTQTTPAPVAGGAATFHIVITSQNDGGIGRFATFSASVPRAAGVFVDSAEAESCETTGGCPNNRTAIRDITPRPFDGAGVYEWDVTLDNLGAGTFNVAVGVNDINNNRLSSGDRNAGIAVPFTVAEGEGEAGEGEGEEGEGEGEGEGAEGEGEAPPPDGSCCAGSATQASLGFAGLLLLGRRRGHRGVAPRR